MRILLLSNRYPPQVLGGAEILAASVAGELERQGHEVEILTSAGHLQGPEQDGRIWRTLHFIPRASVHSLPWPWRQLDLAHRYYRRYHCSANGAELRRIIGARRPDVAYVWEITGLGVTSLLGALPALAIPTVFQLGSYWLPYALSPRTPQSHVGARWLKRCLIGDLARPTWTSAIAVSMAVKQVYVNAGCDPDRIQVIHNSVDPQFLLAPRVRSSGPDTSPPTAIELLYVGRLCAEKGVMTLLQTLVLLAEEMPGMSVRSDSGHQLHLTIVGTGERDYHQHIQRYIHRHHLADHVTLHGQVARSDLIGIYDRADILIVPSHWNEPFGLVAVEAMARQLPVVASAVGGLTEILTDGMDGMLVPPGDERALASALRQLIARPDLRERLGRAARMTVASRFSLSEQVANVADHLQRSIRGETPPPTAARPAGSRSFCPQSPSGQPLNASGRIVERGSRTS